MHRSRNLSAGLFAIALLCAAPTLGRADEDAKKDSDAVVDVDSEETANELARLELEREKALSEADAEAEKERAEIEKAIAEQGDTKKLRARRRDLERSHAGARMRLERGFAEKRQRMLGKKRGAVARQMTAMEEERATETQAAEAAFEKELAAARLAAQRGGDEREFERTRGRLRRNRNEKLDKIERKYGQKRRRMLEKKGKLHPLDAEEHPGKGDDGERGKSGEHRQDGEKRGHGRDKQDDEDGEEPEHDESGDGDGDDDDKGKGKGKGKGGGRGKK